MLDDAVDPEQAIAASKNRQATTCKLLLLLPAHDCDGAVLVGDNDGGGHAQEHAVLDDAGDPEQAVADVAQVPADAVLEEHLDDVVAVVGDKGRLQVFPLGGGGGPEPGVEAGHAVEQVADESQRVGRAERDDLDGDGARASETGDELGLVDDDDEPVPGALDHLLAEQRPAASLDEVEVRVDLVGAVDGERDPGARGGVEREQRDPDGGRVGLRLEGGGHPGHARERARAEEVPEAVQRVRRRGPRAQAQRHAGLHELHRAVRRHALQLVLRELPRRRRRGGGGAAHGEVGRRRRGVLGREGGSGGLGFGNGRWGVISGIGFLRRGRGGI